MRNKIIEQIENIEYKQCESDEQLVYKFVSNVSIMSDDFIPKFKNGHVLKLYILNSKEKSCKKIGQYGGSYKQILAAINFLRIKGE